MTAATLKLDRAVDPWWTILGITRDASIEQIARAYRQLSKTAQPNAGGDRAAWDRLSAAYEAGKQENR